MSRRRVTVVLFGSDRRPQDFDLQGNTPEEWAHSFRDQVGRHFDDHEWKKYGVYCSAAYSKTRVLWRSLPRYLQSKESESYIIIGDGKNMSYSHPLDYSVPFTISPETMVYNYPKNEVGNDPTHAWIMAEVIDNSLEAYQRTDSSGPGEVELHYIFGADNELSFIVTVDKACGFEDLSDISTFGHRKKRPAGTSSDGVPYYLDGNISYFGQGVKKMLNYLGNEYVVFTRRHNSPRWASAEMRVGDAIREYNQNRNDRQIISFVTFEDTHSNQPLIRAWRESSPYLNALLDQLLAKSGTIFVTGNILPDRKVEINRAEVDVIARSIRKMYFFYQNLSGGIIDDFEGRYLQISIIKASSADVNSAEIIELGRSVEEEVQAALKEAEAEDFEQIMCKEPADPSTLSMPEDIISELEKRFPWLNDLDQLTKLRLYCAQKRSEHGGRNVPFAFRFRMRIKSPRGDGGLTDQMEEIWGVSLYVPTKNGLEMSKAVGYLAKGGCRAVFFYKGRLVCMDGLEQLPFLGDRNFARPELNKAHDRVITLLFVGPVRAINVEKQAFIRKLDISRENTQFYLEGQAAPVSTRDGMRNKYQMYLQECINRFERNITLSDPERTPASPSVMSVDGQSSIRVFKKIKYGQWGQADISINERSPVFISWRLYKLDGADDKPEAGLFLTAYGQVVGFEAPALHGDKSIMVSSCTVVVKRLPEPLFGSMYKVDIKRCQLLKVTGAASVPAVITRFANDQGPRTIALIHQHYNGIFSSRIQAEADVRRSIGLPCLRIPSEGARAPPPCVIAGSLIPVLKVAIENGRAKRMISWCKDNPLRLGDCDKMEVVQELMEEKSDGAGWSLPEGDAKLYKREGNVNGEDSTFSFTSGPDIGVKKDGKYRLRYKLSKPARFSSLEQLYGFECTAGIPCKTVLEASWKDQPLVLGQPREIILSFQDEHNNRFRLLGPKEANDEKEMIKAWIHERVRLQISSGDCAVEPYQISDIGQYEVKISICLANPSQALKVKFADRNKVTDSVGCTITFVSTPGRESKIYEAIESCRLVSGEPVKGRLYVTDMAPVEVLVNHCLEAFEYELVDAYDIRTSRPDKEGLVVVSMPSSSARDQDRRFLETGISSIPKVPIRIQNPSLMSLYTVRAIYFPSEWQTGDPAAGRFACQIEVPVVPNPEPDGLVFIVDENELGDDCLIEGPAGEQLSSLTLRLTSELCRAQEASFIPTADVMLEILGSEVNFKADKDGLIPMQNSKLVFPTGAGEVQDFTFKVRAQPLQRQAVVKKLKMKAIAGPPCAFDIAWLEALGSTGAPAIGSEGGHAADSRGPEIAQGDVLSSCLSIKLVDRHGNATDVIPSGLRGMLRVDHGDANKPIYLCPPNDEETQEEPREVPIGECGAANRYDFDGKAWAAYGEVGQCTVSVKVSRSCHIPIRGSNSLTFQLVAGQPMTIDVHDFPATVKAVVPVDSPRASVFGPRRCPIPPDQAHLSLELPADGSIMYLGRDGDQMDVEQARGHSTSPFPSFIITPKIVQADDQLPLEASVTLIALVKDKQPYHQIFKFAVDASTLVKTIEFSDEWSAALPSSITDKVFPPVLLLVDIYGTAARVPWSAGRDTAHAQLKVSLRDPGRRVQTITATTGADARGHLYQLPPDSLKKKGNYSLMAHLNYTFLPSSRQSPEPAASASHDFSRLAGPGVKVDLQPAVRPPILVNNVGKLFLFRAVQILVLDADNNSTTAEGDRVITAVLRPAEGAPPGQPPLLEWTDGLGAGVIRASEQASPSLSLQVVPVTFTAGEYNLEISVQEGTGEVYYPEPIAVTLIDQQDIDDLNREIIELCNTIQKKVENDYKTNAGLLARAQGEAGALRREVDDIRHQLEELWSRLLRCLERRHPQYDDNDRLEFCKAIINMGRQQSREARHGVSSADLGWLRQNLGNDFIGVVADLGIVENERDAAILSGLMGGHRSWLSTVVVRTREAEDVVKRNKRDLFVISVPMINPKRDQKLPHHQRISRLPRGIPQPILAATLPRPVDGEHADLLARIMQSAVGGTLVMPTYKQASDYREEVVKHHGFVPLIMTYDGHRVEADGRGRGRDMQGARPPKLGPNSQTFRGGIAQDPAYEAALNYRNLYGKLNNLLMQLSAKEQEERGIEATLDTIKEGIRTDLARLHELLQRLDPPMETPLLDDVLRNPAPLLRTIIAKVSQRNGAQEQSQEAIGKRTRASSSSSSQSGGAADRGGKRRRSSGGSS